LVAPTVTHVRPQLEQAHTYKRTDPRVRGLLEDAREAHWRLTSTKGFKALQVG
jgi:hypothetical protein